MKNIIALLSLFLLVSCSVNAQNKTEEKKSPFLFLVESDTKEIKLKGEFGSAWTQLGFTLGANQTVAFTEMGMVGGDLQEIANSALFLITVQRTQTGLQFKSLKGTAWLDLSFGCGGLACKQYVDFFGMATK
jgi:hypothetical protein